MRIKAGWVAVAVLSCAAATPVQAQRINEFFPTGVPGPNQQIGVTVGSRARPLYSSLGGVRAGSFVIRPQLEETLFYNSNPTGLGPRGSFGADTRATISFGSDWRRNSLGGFLQVDDIRYFDLPQNNYTNWSAGLRGGYTIRDSQLEASYVHRVFHQTGLVIGSVASSLPIEDQADLFSVSYPINVSRFTFTPEAGLAFYRFGPGTAGGVRFSQAELDRDVLSAGLTTRYSMSDVGGLVLAIRGAQTTFVRPRAGVPSNNASTVDVLAGVDYQSSGVWRYQVLAGIEVQDFQAAQYATQVATVVEANAIWTPSGRSTFTGSLTRNIQPPLASGNNGFVLTQGRLAYDFELKRNVLLQGRGRLQYAEYLLGGAQVNYSVGAGVTWLISPGLRATFDVDYTRQTGGGRLGTPGNPSAVTTGAFEQLVAGFGLHFAL